MDLSQKQTNALHDQIKHNFHLAWFNLLREKTLQNPPDFDWIVTIVIFRFLFKRLPQTLGVLRHLLQLVQ